MIDVARLAAPVTIRVIDFEASDPLEANLIAKAIGHHYWVALARALQAPHQHWKEWAVAIETGRSKGAARLKFPVFGGGLKPAEIEILVPFVGCTTVSEAETYIKTEVFRDVRDLVSAEPGRQLLEWGEPLEAIPPKVFHPPWLQDVTRDALLHIRSLISG